jgi:hypothetical protein
MIAAYANHSITQSGKGFPDYLKLVWSNDTSSAQSIEALKVYEKVQESLEWRKRTKEMLSIETPSYNHITPRQTLSVKCHYKYMGRMSPRQFPLDE